VYALVPYPTIARNSCVTVHANHAVMADLQAACTAEYLMNYDNTALLYAYTALCLWDSVLGVHNIMHLLLIQILMDYHSSVVLACS
jgi:hypothetical protein